jgi:hypothetical protein
VTGYRERDLEQHAREVFRAQASGLIQTVASLGKSAGSPWTADQKNAALAAMPVLALQQGRSARENL